MRQWLSKPLGRAGARGPVLKCDWDNRVHVAVQGRNSCGQWRQIGKVERGFPRCSYLSYHGPLQIPKEPGTTESVLDVLAQDNLGSQCLSVREMNGKTFRGL